jgi:hypothetical protein
MHSPIYQLHQLHQPHRLQSRPLAISVVAIAALTLCAPALMASGPPGIAEGADFGAGLTLREATPLAAIVERPEDWTSKPVLLHGRISEVCQRKGCWTILQEGDAHVRVRFKDYGFFIPTDASGSEAYVEGVVKSSMLSEKDARHYAEETRGGDPSAIDGPQREVGFTATGVRLVGRSE